MFDVSLSELMVIAVVALIVIGPERLPKVARTAGHVLGRLQRYVSTVKADINREMQLEELKKLQQEVAEQVRSTESAVSQDLKSLETSLNQSIAPPAAVTAGADVTAATSANTEAVPVTDTDVWPEATSSPGSALEFGTPIPSVEEGAAQHAATPWSRHAPPVDEAAVQQAAAPVSMQDKAGA